MTTHRDPPTIRVTSSAIQVAVFARGGAPSGRGTYQVPRASHERPGSVHRLSSLHSSPKHQPTDNIDPTCNAPYPPNDRFTTAYDQRLITSG